MHTNSKLNGPGLHSERFFLKLVTVHKGQRQCRVIKRILHRAQHCTIQCGSLQCTVQYTALHCIALYCSGCTVQCSVPYSIQLGALHCTALQCTVLLWLYSIQNSGVDKSAVEDISGDCHGRRVSSQTRANLCPPHWKNRWGSPNSNRSPP